MNLKNEFGENKWDDFHGESPLIAVFKSFHRLNPDIEQIINEQTFPVSFAKGKHLAAPHQRNRYIFLIITGAVHGYIKAGNQKITTWIAAESELAGSIQNLWQETDSDEYIESIEPVIAIAIPHTMSRYLYDHFPIANYVGRKMTEIYYKGASERAFIARLPTATKRYERFLISYRHLVERVPLKFITSFLAMRLETLSRIRNAAIKNGQRSTDLRDAELN